MLTEEDNEAVCRVGPGTITGDLMRQYWLPFLYPWELEPDSTPIRVRLLGEDLIAFRDSSGRFGLLGSRCAHRGAGMFYGRNEENGLRCVYHGWKYDVTGACVDLPNEPEEDNRKSRIFIKAYLCAEHGGMVWAYMGPRQSNPPGLPQFEWTLLPETHRRHAMKYVLHNNYLQALEGDIDSSHNAFLHNRNWEDIRSPRRRDRAPVYEAVDTAWGTMASAVRKGARPGEVFHRIYQMVMPVHVMIAGTCTMDMWVPIDDEHTLMQRVSWDPKEPLEDRSFTSRDVGNPGMGPMRNDTEARFFADWWPSYNEENNFGINREEQRTKSYTGLPTTRADDSAMTASMGPIMDRTEEHLGPADILIAQTRQRLLKQRGRFESTARCHLPWMTPTSARCAASTPRCPRGQAGSPS